MESERPDFLTLAQVADRLNVSTRTVRRLISREKLPRCKHIGKILVPRHSVDRFVNE